MLIMNWKQQLKYLEDSEKYEEAVIFMEKIINEDPDDVDRYIFMLYLLVDFVMEPHSQKVEDIKYNSYWQNLAKKYFLESYEKFSKHQDKRTRCDYLFFVGHIGVTGCYMCGMDEYLPNQMIEAAKTEDPDYPVYRIDDRNDLTIRKMLFDPQSLLRKALRNKGSVGRNLFYIFSDGSPYQ